MHSDQSSASNLKIIDGNGWIQTFTSPHHFQNQFNVNLEISCYENSIFDGETNLQLMQ